VDEKEDVNKMMRKKDLSKDVKLKTRDQSSDTN